VINDDNGAWPQPAFTQMYRLLKPGSFCVSFYGWSKADRFIAAWRSAGFRMVGAFPALPARAGPSPRQG
jgi:DNA modification methylase